MEPRSSRSPPGDKVRSLAILTKDQRLESPTVHTWKYVDDTTIAEIVPRDAPSDVQSAVSFVEDWSWGQNMQVNADKYKEMIIDFKKNKHSFSPL